MAEMPPASEQGGEEGGGAGGIQEVLLGVDQTLSKINKSLSSNQVAPPKAVQAFQAAQEAFRQGLEILSGGDGQEGPSETTTPEQGGNPNAVPMSMERR